MKAKPMACYKSIMEYKESRPRGQKARKKGEDKKVHCFKNSTWKKTSGGYYEISSHYLLSLS